ncbi:MAG TPA: outer membrane beta-barrel protein [Gammaproteobacteria bacterium]|nr:outer membrane beta-barrel protein [Gammaproteobacteria bacterium]
MACFFATGGHAAENGFYVGAARGEMKTRHESAPSDLFDEQDSSFKVIVGWRPVDWFAVEGSYFDLGDVTLQQAVPDLSPFRLEQKGYDAFAVFLVDIAMFDLFLKAGAVKSSADLTTNTIAGQASSVDHDTDFAWGAGAQFRVRKLTTRIEYERLEISNGDNFKPPQVVSVGVTWSF